MSIFDRETRTCPDCGREWEALTIWNHDVPCGDCGMARYQRRLAEINESHSFVIESIGGACPTQAWGRSADDRPFYFRARHGDWTLELGPRGAPTSIHEWPDRSESVIAGGDDPSGGFMDAEDVLAILDRHLAADRKAAPDHAEEATA